MKRFSLFVLSCFFSLSAWSLDVDSIITEKGSLVVPLTESFEIFSNSVGDSYQITVGLPASYGQQDKNYPVLYVLDGHWYSALAVNTALIMSGEASELIVVNVGYPTFDPAEIQRRRSQDTTPSPASLDGYPKSYAKKIEKFVASLPKINGGGAKNFLKFINNELKPYINKRYKTNPNNIGIFGTSGGGLFSAYVLLTEPDSFNKYTIGSPDLYWGKEEIYKLEDIYAENNDDLNAQVFIAGGTGELNQMPGHGTVTHVSRFYEALKLRNYPNLDLSVFYFPDEMHMSVVPGMLVRTIRTQFPKESSQ